MFRFPNAVVSLTTALFLIVPLAAQIVNRTQIKCLTNPKATERTLNGNTSTSFYEIFAPGYYEYNCELNATFPLPPGILISPPSNSAVTLEVWSYFFIVIIANLTLPNVSISIIFSGAGAVRLDNSSLFSRQEVADAAFDAMVVLYARSLTAQPFNSFSFVLNTSFSVMSTLRPRGLRNSSAFSIVGVDGFSPPPKRLLLLHITKFGSLVCEGRSEACLFNFAADNNTLVDGLFFAPDEAMRIVIEGPMRIADSQLISPSLEPLHGVLVVMDHSWYAALPSDSERSSFAAEYYPSGTQVGVAFDNSSFLHGVALLGFRMVCWNLVGGFQISNYARLFYAQRQFSNGTYEFVNSKVNVTDARLLSTESVVDVVVHFEWNSGSLLHPDDGTIILRSFLLVCGSKGAAGVTLAFSNGYLLVDGTSRLLSSGGPVFNVSLSFVGTGSNRVAVTGRDYSHLIDVRNSSVVFALDAVEQQRLLRGTSRCGNFTVSCVQADLTFDSSAKLIAAVWLTGEMTLSFVNSTLTVKRAILLYLFDHVGLTTLIGNESRVALSQTGAFLSVQFNLTNAKDLWDGAAVITLQDDSVWCSIELCVLQYLLSTNNVIVALSMHSFFLLLTRTASLAVVVPSSLTFRLQGGSLMAIDTASIFMTCTFPSVTAVTITLEASVVTLKETAIFINASTVSGMFVALALDAAIIVNSSKFVYCRRMVLQCNVRLSSRSLLWLNQSASFIDALQSRDLSLFAVGNSTMQIVRSCYSRGSVLYNLFVVVNGSQAVVVESTFVGAAVAALGSMNCTFAQGSILVLSHQSTWLGVCASQATMDLAIDTLVSNSSVALNGASIYLQVIDTDFPTVIRQTFDSASTVTLVMSSSWLYCYPLQVVAANIHTVVRQGSIVSATLQSSWLLSIFALCNVTFLIQGNSSVMVQSNSVMLESFGNVSATMIEIDSGSVLSLHTGFMAVSRFACICSVELHIRSYSHVVMDSGAIGLTPAQCLVDVTLRCSGSSSLGLTNISNLIAGSRGASVSVVSIAFVGKAQLKVDAQSSLLFTTEMPIENVGVLVSEGSRAGLNASGLLIVALYSPSGAELTNVLSSNISLTISGGALISFQQGANALYCFVGSIVNVTIRVSDSSTLYCIAGCKLLLTFRSVSLVNVNVLGNSTLLLHSASTFVYAKSTIVRISVSVSNGSRLALEGNTALCYTPYLLSSVTISVADSNGAIIIDREAMFVMATVVLDVRIDIERCSEIQISGTSAVVWASSLMDTVVVAITASHRGSITLSNNSGLLTCEDGSLHNVTIAVKSANVILDKSWMTLHVYDFVRGAIRVEGNDDVMSNVSLTSSRIINGLKCASVVRPMFRRLEDVNVTIASIRNISLSRQSAMTVISLAKQNYCSKNSSGHAFVHTLAVRATTLEMDEMSSMILVVRPDDTFVATDPCSTTVEPHLFRVDLDAVRVTQSDGWIGRLTVMENLTSPNVTYVPWQPSRFTFNVTMSNVTLVLPSNWPPVSHVLVHPVVTSPGRARNVTVVVTAWLQGCGNVILRHSQRMLELLPSRLQLLPSSVAFEMRVESVAWSACAEPQSSSLTASTPSSLTATTSVMQTQSCEVPATPSDAVTISRPTTGSMTRPDLTVTLSDIPLMVERRQPVLQSTSATVQRILFVSSSLSVVVHGSSSSVPIGSPAFGLWQLQVTSMLRFLRTPSCDARGDDAPASAFFADPIENPLGMQLGTLSSQLSYAGGAIIGNVIFATCLASLIAMLRACNEAGRAMWQQHGIALCAFDSLQALFGTAWIRFVDIIRTRFPGLLFGPLMMVLQPLVGASVFVLTHSDCTVGGALVLGLFGLLVVAVTPFALEVWTVLLQWRLSGVKIPWRTVPNWHRKHLNSRLLEMFHPRGVWVSRQGEAVCHSNTVLRRFGPVFEDYHDQCVWYFTVDVGVAAILTGVVVGVGSSMSAECSAAAPALVWPLVGIQLALTIGSFYFLPLQAEFCNGASCFLNLFALITLLIGIPATNVDNSYISTLTSIQAALTAVVTVLPIGAWAQRGLAVVRRQNAKLRSKQQDATNDVATPRHVPLLSQGAIHQEPRRDDSVPITSSVTECANRVGHPDDEVNYFVELDSFPEVAYDDDATPPLRTTSVRVRKYERHALSEVFSRLSAVMGLIEFSLPSLNQDAGRMGWQSEASIGESALSALVRGICAVQRQRRCATQPEGGQ